MRRGQPCEAVTISPLVVAAVSAVTLPLPRVPAAASCVHAAFRTQQRKQSSSVDMEEGSDAGPKNTKRARTTRSEEDERVKRRVSPATQEVKSTPPSYKEPKATAKTDETNGGTLVTTAGTTVIGRRN
ncbi:hypothetical protein B296_00000919 [Ensete ventricosum]|uniref:Secreted protein n=1 Tax=Ensete ventricosum TaxID=4639 RepID=A0A427BAT7_ENSVE|nr:hypothetical protein B296_00000919 [Ensete ventricosum]